jgi:hypothetical protein
MINQDIKYSFNQLEIALVAFIGNLELKLQKFIPDLPVYIQHTSDLSYYLDSKFNKTEVKEIYQKTPRFVLNIDDMQYDDEQMSNKYNKVTYLYEEIPYVASVRRIPLKITINGDFVSPNFIKALENFEIMTTVNIEQNTFTYEFLGNTFESVYGISQIGFEKPGMEVGSGTRNLSIKSGLELQIHLILPRIQTIKKLTDSNWESIDYSIIINNIDDTTKLDLIINNEE